MAAGTRLSSSLTEMALIATGATLILHFAWEMLQSPVFVSFAGSAWAGTIRCLAAAVGDLLLAAGAYAVTAVVFRRPSWLLRAERWTVPAATWIALGVITTIVLEQWAIDTGRWRYGPDMPILFGVGLLPVLQWIIVPTLTLIVVRATVRL
jgi:hypothetical protein